jgi:hypothetical protein
VFEAFCCVLLPDIVVPIAGGITLGLAMQYVCIGGVCIDDAVLANQGKQQHNYHHSNGNVLESIKPNSQLCKIWACSFSVIMVSST